MRFFVPRLLLRNTATGFAYCPIGQYGYGLRLCPIGQYGYGLRLLPYRAIRLRASPIALSGNTATLLRYCPPLAGGNTLRGSAIGLRQIRLSNLYTAILFQKASIHRNFQLKCSHFRFIPIK